MTVFTKVNCGAASLLLIVQVAVSPRPKVIELVPTGDHWVGVRLPQDVMFELLRTPTYSSWQGERWLFCCQRPMVYLGDWRSREEFSRRSPDGDGRRFFEDIVQDSDPDLWENELGEDTGVYVFRCSLCERLAAHWDAA